MIRTFLVSLSLLTISVFSGKGQISYGGQPESFTIRNKASVNIPLVIMEAVDNRQLILNEASIVSSKSNIFAITFDTDITLEKDGIWEETENYKIWRVAIKSNKAYSLNIIFDEFILPTGASVFVYTPDQKIVRGAFNANNEQTSGKLPIYPLPGDEIIVEYNEPLHVAYPGKLRISQVNHDYKNAFGERPLGEAGSCNIDVFCAEAQPYVSEKQSVVQLIISGRELCTGTLVNNIRKDRTPYLLTAGHCIENETDAQSSVFCFNYESPFCGDGSSVNGYADQTMTGAILRARTDFLDFALVELENIPPPEFRPYYSGWDISTSVPASTFSIHHPKGDVKKVAIDLDQPSVGTYSKTTYLNDGFWHIKRWDTGTTESGSSGGPLFNSNKLIVGTLTGGSANCASSVDDYFSMLNKQWDYYPSANQQLKVWLNPDKADVVSLESINPYELPDLCASFSNQVNGENYLTRKTKDLKGVISGNNVLGTTEIAEKFTQTEATTISTISLGVARIYRRSTSTERLVTINIKEENAGSGLPGEALFTRTLPLSTLEAGKMNLISLDSPIMVNGNYFVTVGFDFKLSTDSLVLYHAAERAELSKNRAYVKIGSDWQPFYWVPQIAISTSLLISVNGCNSELADPEKPAPIPGENRFALRYPLGTGLNYISLINNGDEEFGTITIYDRNGKIISITEHMLTNTPLDISLNGLSGQGIYYMRVSTTTDTQTLKLIGLNAY